MTDLIPAWDGDQLRPMEKLHVHRAGLRHKAVSVFVLRDEEILIQRRALSKYHTPGLWANTCCTHPHWQELPRDCAQRRLEQELGIRGLEPQFRQQIEYRSPVDPDMIEHEQVDLFVAEADAGLCIEENPQEVMETRWISPSLLVEEIAHDPARFTPWLRIYMRDHAGVIFGPLEPDASSWLTASKIRGA